MPLSELSQNMVHSPDRVTSMLTDKANPLLPSHHAMIPTTPAPDSSDAFCQPEVNQNSNYSKDIPAYPIPSFEITNIDKLSPVHYLILQHLRYVDPLALLTVSREQYKAVNPLLYHRISLSPQNAEKFFYGMTDFTSPRFQRGESKLDAMKKNKILGIFHAKSTNILLENLKKFGRTRCKTPRERERKRTTPFEGVEHLEFEHGILHGFLVASMLYENHSGNGSHYFDGDYHEKIEPVPAQSFLNVITKYINQIKTLCISWDTIDHPYLQDEIPRIGSTLLRGIIRKSPLLSRIVIHAETKEIAEFGVINLDNIDKSRRESLDIRYQIRSVDKYDEELMPIKYRLREVLDLYDKSEYRNNNLSFTWEGMTQEVIGKTLKKVERILDRDDQYGFISTWNHFKQNRKRLLEVFESSWAFPNDDGNSVNEHLCQCNQRMFHSQAAQNWREWENPSWAQRKPEPKLHVSRGSMSPSKSNRHHKLDCVCGKCYDSDSECGSVLEGWDAVWGFKKDWEDIGARIVEGNGDDGEEEDCDDYDDYVDDWLFKL